METVTKSKEPAADSKEPAADSKEPAADSKTLIKDPPGFRYFDDVLPEALKEQFLAYLVAIPADVWQTLGSRGGFRTSVLRRIGFGNRAKDIAVPEELEGLLKPILDHIMPFMTEEEQRLLRVFFDMEPRFTVNRYTKGMVLGAHFDDRDEPDGIVLGFTMGTKTTTHRRMTFTNPATGEVFSKATYDNSIYMFYGPMYYEFKHASGKPVDGDVYSITIRANC